MRLLLSAALLAYLAACSSGSSSSGAAAGGPGAGPNGGTNTAPPGSGPPGSTGPGAPSLFPLVSPPVRAAAPAGFGGGLTAQRHSLGRASREDLAPSADPFRLEARAAYAAPLPNAGGFHVLSLSSTDIRSRFFSAGPTNIYSLLGAIDERVSGYNQRAHDGAHACLTQSPVAYTLHPVGQSVPFYAQCFESIGSSTPGDPGFVQFGQRDGVTYYYSAVGAGWTAAILTPIGSADDAGASDAGADDAGASDASGDDADARAASADDAGADAGASVTAYRVHAWSGVGYLNASSCGNKSGFDDCSYGVIELTADASRASFEIAVAGIGFGYCGAQLKSDGTHVYGIGSADMASTCGAADTFCVAASDVTTPATCSGAITSFEIAPLGRVSSAGPNAGGPGVDAGPDARWAASAYPGGDANSVTLDGTTSDSLYFGPTAPTPGVGAF